MEAFGGTKILLDLEAFSGTKEVDFLTSNLLTKFLAL